MAKFKQKFVWFVHRLPDYNPSFNRIFADKLDAMQYLQGYIDGNIKDIEHFKTLQGWKGRVTKFPEMRVSDDVMSAKILGEMQCYYITAKRMQILYLNDVENQEFDSTKGVDKMRIISTKHWFSYYKRLCKKGYVLKWNSGGLLFFRRLNRVLLIEKEK